MRRTKLSRCLSLVLAFVMVLSMVPAGVLAAEPATWARVDLADITAEDTIMVTMTNPNGVTYALHTVQSGSKGNDAKVVTVTDDTVTTDTVADYGWTVTPVEGGYTLKAGEAYLYTEDANNGVRMGDTQAVWAVDGNYLSTSDGTQTRWLGVYDNNGGDYSAVTAPNWRAYKNTTGNTKDQTLAFFKLTSGAQEPPVSGNQATLMTEAPADGDTVLIYNAANTAVLGVANDGKRQAGVTAADVDGAIAVTDEMAKLLVDVEENVYTFTLDGKYLTSGETGNSLSFAEELTDCGKWTLESVNGKWVIMNVGANYNGNYNQALEYYYGFTTYGVQDTEIYQMDFYLTSAESGTPEPTEPSEPSEPTEPAEPEPPVEQAASLLTEAPANGSTVLIYNAANTAVLGAEASGSRLAAVTAADVDGAIALTDGMAQLVVGVEENVYTFTLDGKYLTTGETGNSLFFQEELTDCGKWTLEATNGKWVIKNVGANYNGNYNQALEYYNGFTTYGVKDSAIYQMDFYQVPTVQTGKVTSAEDFTSGSYVLVVETGYAPGVLDDTWVTAVQPAVVGDQVTDAKGGIWSLTVTGDTVELCDSNGTVIAPKGGNNNGISGGAYQWMWSFDAETETFTFSGQGEDTVNLASNVTSDNKFRGYKQTTIAGNPGGYPDDFTVYKVDPNNPGGGSDAPLAGRQVVLYNLSAQGVLAEEGDNQVIENAPATVENGVATPENGGVVFTIEENGNYYRFFNETYGYLCSNGTGNNAFYSLEASEDADWLLSNGKSGGFFLESRTAKYNGTYSQYLEYYSASYKTYSMYNVTDYDIYEFLLLPVAEGVNRTGGIVNQPKVVFDSLAEAFVNTDYSFSFTVEAVFGVESLTVAVNGTELALTENHSYTIPAAQVTGESLTIAVSGVDTKGVAFSATETVAIQDEPVILEVAPAAGAQTGDNKRPTITVTTANIGENAVAAMTVAGVAVEAKLENGVVTYTPEADLADGRTTVTVTVTRADGKSVSKTWSFTVGQSQYELYFGQLHSHTTYSDGSGTLESALDYIGSLPESANVDFVAFTDHSNYFDSSSAVNPEGALYDMSLATADSQKLWSAYKSAVAEFNASQQSVVAIGGFEMTWSGGPGHMNAFNTPGVVSRNNSTLNNKTGDAGMKAYYALLSQPEGADTISQFNHPGTTFGNFSDFAYWDALIDSRVYLVEVGNGEGQVGAGGYFPSYEQYTMALDKGWHLAPTNNQDNHKGKWGNANDARDVILTDNFTEEGLYEAIRNYRVYATEDKNLEIGYTVNGNVLGSMLEEVPETLKVEVTVYDPDTTDSISKVEVIVNSGKVAYTWDDPAQLANGLLTAELAPDYSYYYIRVTEGDGDTAVTAPVWVGETLKLGISSVVCGTSTPVTGEELTITTTLFNSETVEAAVKSLTYSVGSQVLAVDTTGYTIPASGSAAVDFAYTPEVAKVMAVTVTVVVELEGVEYTFSMDVNLDIQDASKLVYVGIDAAHYNEYVAGNYKDSMGNFGELAAGWSVRTVELKTSQDLIAACSNEKYAALILTAPSRRLAAAQEAMLTYTAEELAAIQAFNAAGGTVILAGWSDNYENYDAIKNNADAVHMAATQNALLEALGSSLRISDDATMDDSLNGGQSQRLYFNAYNMDSFLMDGVEVDENNPNDRLYTEVYSQYGGASIYAIDGQGEPTATLPETVTPIVYGHTSTYSKDSDGDGLGGDSVPKYAYGDTQRLLVLASEQVGDNGLIIVAGAAFMSNFEVQATIEDSGSEKNYSNYKLCENLVSYLNPVTVTDIAEVQAQPEEGIKYTIEGVVTSNASGYDKNTAFFDCIYLQDDTAGINAFPVAGNYQIGDKVRITGTTSSYQGERQIAVTKIELLSQGNEVVPVEITAKELNDGSKLGSLVTLKGTVESFEYANGLVQTILITDAAGDVGRVFIDGYITTAYDVVNLAVGASITVTGLASYDDSFAGPAPRIRTRDRRDVVCEVAPDKFVDVPRNTWYYDAVYGLTNLGIIKGITDTTFAPEGILTRGEWVTMLYRAAGSPKVEGQSSFTDVPEKAFYAKAFAWAEAEGIVCGVGANLGAPLMTITREQMVTMLYRYDGQNKTGCDLSGYEDVNDISYYAFDAFEWAVAKGYVNGMTETTLAPQTSANRAQAATIVYRYLSK